MSTMRMPFGKHQGWKISAVPASYLRWLKKEEVGGLEVQIAVEEEQRRRRGVRADRRAAELPALCTECAPMLNRELNRLLADAYDEETFRFADGLRCTLLGAHTEHLGERRTVQT